MKNSYLPNLIVAAIILIDSILLSINAINSVVVKLALLAVMAGSIAAWIVIGRRNRQQELNNQRAISQLKSDIIKSSLDPHFLFNAINSVSFSIRKSDTNTALSNLGTISKVMRTAFGDIDRYSHELNDEIDFIKNYLTLEKFRFKEQFDYNIKIMPYVNDMREVPCFAIFCFVENALKKGILSKEGHGNLNILIDEKPEPDGMLIIRISDDGLYRDLENPDNFTHNITTVNSLVDRLNNINSTKIELAYSAMGYTDDKPYGCIAELHIPHEMDYDLGSASI